MCILDLLSTKRRYIRNYVISVAKYVIPVANYHMITDNNMKVNRSDDIRTRWGYFRMAKHCGIHSLK